MEDAKYSANIQGNVSGFVQGDYAHVTIHVYPPASSPASPYRSILGGPPLTDPRSIQQRDILVESVIAQLIQPGLNALVLTGIGGVGKSTLAGLVYRYVQNHLSEGLFIAAPIWLSIDATTTFANIMGSIYQAIEKPLPDLGQLSPASQAQALFFTLSRAPARLIVLDQCEVVLDGKTGKALSDRPGLGEWFDALNRQPFETGCRLLFTSRQRPRGKQADPPTFFQIVPVGGLSIPEGVELFGLRGVQAMETEMQQAVISCSGHGLSITLLLNLVQDYNMPLADLLADVSLWEGDIATNLLDTVFQQLSSLERALLYAFSIYRLPVSIEAAQAALKPEYQKSAHPALRMLLNQHLIQSVGDATYQIHVIIARYAQQHFGETDEQANQQALQEAHSEAAHYYKELSARHAPSPEQRRSLKEVEPLLEAIWHLTQAGAWQQAYELAIDEEIFETLDRYGGYAQLVKVCQLFLTSSSWQGQPAETAFLCSSQGEGYLTLGRPQQALQCCEQALALHQEVGNRLGEGATLNSLGKIYDGLGKPTEALYYYEQGLAIAQEVGNRLGEGVILNNIGILFSDLGNPIEALQYLEQALAIIQEVGNRLGEGVTLNNIGKIYDDLNKPIEALHYYEQALTLRQEVGNRLGEGVTLNNLGLLYDGLGKPTEALHYYEQALAIRQEVGDRLGEGVTSWNIGVFFLKLQHYSAALAAFLFAQRLFQQVKSPHQEGVEDWINDLELCIGEGQFRELVSQVSPQPEHILKQALSAWKEQNKD